MAGRYSTKQFYEDKKRLLGIVGKSISYTSTDASTFRVSFADRILGLNVDVYLSKKTIVVRSKSRIDPTVKRKLSWEAFADIFAHLYNYI